MVSAGTAPAQLDDYIYGEHLKAIAVYLARNAQQHMDG